MDKIEARAILEAFLHELKTCPYLELQKLISNPVCLKKQGQSGASYQIEYEAVWDFEPGGNLRIIASIDDGGLVSAMVPLCLDFLVTPAGKIID
ncbi:MAG: hypothetical protein ACOZF2_01405 [Thermodesulfobacteriota bacterium]